MASTSRLRETKASLFYNGASLEKNTGSAFPVTNGLLHLIGILGQVRTLTWARNWPLEILLIVAPTHLLDAETVTAEQGRAVSRANARRLTSSWKSYFCFFLNT